MTLANQYRQYVVPLLLATFTQTVGSCALGRNFEHHFLIVFVKRSQQLILPASFKRRRFIARLADAPSA
jgi:hypothetical protein